jgi:glycosyltransferase involved in cell wall biosynthesis
MTTPDVTVVVPVYNTMPYLRTCLESLVHQSIGLDRCEVVAVDDGSTDGGGDLLDQYARQYPGSFRVQHQPNSGGPASPCNRGLETARGRYVFFLGADDHLDPEALERLVTQADEWGSDIIFGRMVGVNDRFVDQRIFSTSERDLDLSGPLLPFSLSNTKLFRRSLIEENALRYGLDLRIGSDQVFTVVAMLRARRISVLGDRTYYYAVRRVDAQNISSSSSWRTRLADIGSLMDHLSELTGEGDLRDSIFRRHFGWEVNKMLGRAFLDLERPEQQAVCAGVQRLVEDYLTDGVSRRLEVPTRLRLRLAQHDRVEDLVALAESLGSAGTPPVVLDGAATYLALPGFRQRGKDLPDEWFRCWVEAGQQPVSSSVRLQQARLDSGVLEVRGEIAVDPSSSTNVWLALEPLAAGERAPRAREVEASGLVEGATAPLTLTPGDVTGFHGRMPLTGLVAPGAKLRASLRLRIRIGDTVHDQPLRSPLEPVTQELGRLRVTRVRLAASRKHRLVVKVSQDRIADSLRSRLTWHQSD